MLAQGLPLEQSFLLRYPVLTIVLASTTNKAASDLCIQI